MRSLRTFFERSSQCLRPQRVELFGQNLIIKTLLLVSLQAASTISYARAPGKHGNQNSLDALRTVWKLGTSP